MQIRKIAQGRSKMTNRKINSDYLESKKGENYDDNGKKTCISYSRRIVVWTESGLG